MNLRTETVEFFEKAKELGLVDEIDQQLEDRKHARRLAVIAKIKELPTEAQTELPALGKACTAAHKALQLAEEAYKTADCNYKELSVRSYGAQLKFEGARSALEKEAIDLSPKFLRTAYEDLSVLDGLTRDAFALHFEEVPADMWKTRMVEVGNGEAIIACRNKIKAGSDRIMAMMLEPTAPEVAQAEVSQLLAALEKEAYAVGVDRKKFAGRREPVDVAAKVEDSAIRAAAKRTRAIDSLSV